MMTTHTNPDGSKVSISYAPGTKVSIGKNVTLGSNVKVSGSCTIGDNVTLGNDVQLNEAIIGQNTRIGLACRITGIIPPESYVESGARIAMPTSPDKAACGRLRISQNAKVRIQDASALEYLDVGINGILETEQASGQVKLPKAGSQIVNMKLVRGISLPITSPIEWNGNVTGLATLTGEDTIFTFFGCTLVLHGDKLYNGPQEEFPLVNPLLQHMKKLVQWANTAEGRARAAEARVTELETKLALRGGFDD